MIVERFQDKVAVITGGASGVGLGIAKALAAEGAQIVLADVEIAALGRASSELEQQGSPVWSRATNVADPHSVKQLCDFVADRYFKSPFSYRR